jgi:ATP-dependent Lhr-like helicase
LQRLGRTGRRAGLNRNCLFLTTSRKALLQASALVDLWRKGYVEALSPPALPFHVVAQQIMNLVLQLGGLGRRAWREWILELLGPMGISEDDVRSTIDHMLAEQILAVDGDILGMGPEGERLYGGRNFMALLSVFDSPPLFTVFCGPKDLGVVHPISFRQRDGEPAILSLGGRSWQVVHVDFDHKTAQVVPSEYLGRSRWLGESQPLSFDMCQAIRRVLLGGGPKDVWSKRASAEMELALEEPSCVAAEALIVEIDRGRGRTTWWTFAGLLANAELAGAFPDRPIFDNLSITVNQVLSPESLKEMQGAQGGTVALTNNDPVEVKFHGCVPEHLLAKTHSSRLNDARAVESTLVSQLVVRSSE